MRRLLVAILVLAGLATVLVVLNREDWQRLREERVQARLLQFDDRAVRGLVISVRGVDWRFEALPEGWRLVEPWSDAASGEAVLEFLAALRQTPVARVLEEPEALSAYGLDPPRGRVLLEGVVAPVLDLGNITPTGDAVFARVEGRAGVLVLAPSGLEQSLLARPDPRLLRDLGMLGIHRNDISGLEIETATFELALSREGDGWWVLRPRRVPAAADAVDRVLDSLEAVRIRAFLDGEDPSDSRFGLEDRVLRIRVGSPDRSREIVLGGPGPEGLRFATRDDRDTILGVEATTLGDLDLEIASLGERRLSRANRYDVTSFEYTAGNGRLSVERRDDAWFDESGSPLDQEEVFGLLAGVLSLPVEVWEPAGPEGAKPTAEFRYRLRDGEHGLIEFLPGDRARLSSVSGSVAVLSEPPPPVPLVD